MTVDIDHRAALLDFYRALGGDAWKRNTNWGTDASLDTWNGVTTDAEGKVTELKMGNNGLTGMIPASIGMLETLEILILGNLGSLRSLSINHNPLSGRLPRELMGVRLEQFYWYETDLCSPAHQEFQQWLESIESQGGKGKCSR